jgi:aspartyl protease family protein
MIWPILTPRRHRRKPQPIFVLCADDAKHIGVGLDKPSDSLPATTPSGLTHVATIKLSSLFIQLTGLSDVAAVVSQSHDKCVNLLGMSFLNRLKSYEFSGDTLTLREW